MLDASTEAAADSSQDQFVRRVAETMTVFAVAGETGLARAPSRFKDGREVTFLWSERAQAEKWAGCIAENPRIKELPLGEVLTSLLPALDQHDRRVGTDWSDGPDEPELEPLDLTVSLRRGIVTAFVERVVGSGKIFVVSGMYGPSMMVSKIKPGRQVLPCWSVRERAEMRLEGPWEEMVVSEIPLDRFLNATLPGLAEMNALLCPDNMLGVETIEVLPDALSRRLKV
ncbi:MAG: DUF2750 domain-containing protein [Alphaproteobacteria bacterium]|nr:DUF2750 domain-containing protein [Alphaproteobacteria bacterium]